MNVTIPCPCPSKATGEPRHDADTVTLRDRLDFHAATTIRKAIGLRFLEDPETSTAEVLATLTEHYILFGVEAWTLVDDRGKAVEVSKPAIRERLLSGEASVTDLADAADGLYASQVMLPLLVAAQNSSQRTPMDGSTSARKSGPRKPRRPSRRSSTTTSRTAGTGTITSLPVGGSSSSPNARSA
jgi:hypothetical protein